LPLAATQYCCLKHHSIFGSKKFKQLSLPPAARGALFEKTAPLDPPQKLFIKGGHSLQLERINVNHDRLWFFKVRRLKRRLKASIPGVKSTFK
jgi:hypothetical protein